MANATIIPDHYAPHTPLTERTAPAMSTSPMQHPQHTYPAPAERIFQVRTTTHTGGLVFWFSQSRTVTGTHAECAAALSSAQTHNVIFGWWSLLSLLFMNWIAIGENYVARRTLNSEWQAYAQWWEQYCAPSRPVRRDTRTSSAEPASLI